MSLKAKQLPADVCMILEGSYPYVAGGVSSWAHDLIKMQPHLTFHLLVLVASGSELKLRYELPDNIVGITEVVLQSPPPGKVKLFRQGRIIQQVETPLNALFAGGGLKDIRTLMGIFSDYKGRIGRHILLDSKEAWDMSLRFYKKDLGHCSFLDFFWAWRGMLSGLYSVLQGSLPEAKMYHAISTGYAGLYMARAKIETGRPTMLTEHGIYTNERRIEIAMADWLHEEEFHPHGMSVDQSQRGIRDLWMQGFQSYSLACYEACDRVITLFEGNQNFQLSDGANRDLMEVIPNGIDYEGFKELETATRGENLTVALIGRVVPIKDIKTYIRAVAHVKEAIPEVKAYVLGPFDEDKEYYLECVELVDQLGVSDVLTFTGRVDLKEWMKQIDINVLTSISEGQPLVILEAGAAGIPSIATDVGACREIIEGDSTEKPRFGIGGAIVPLSSPLASAKAMIELLSDKNLLNRRGRAIQQRVAKYYNKTDLQEKYRALYDRYTQTDKQSLLKGER